MQGEGLEKDEGARDALRDRSESLGLFQVMFWPIRESGIGG